MSQVKKEVEKLKIAITHDYLIDYGGAELVLIDLLKTFPNAELFVPVYWMKHDEPEFSNEIKKHKIHLFFLQNFKFLKRFWKILVFLFPIYFEKIDFSRFDIVISNSSAFSKWINKGDAKHIAYINTPPRFLWGMETSTFHKLPRIVSFILGPIINNWKQKDLKYTQNADLIITNSKNIKEKIKLIYEKKSEIIYPPVSVPKIDAENIKEGSFYLVVNRLVAYKHIDKVIEAFNSSQKKLVVIGDGPEKEYLESIAGENVYLTGFIDQEKKFEYLSQTKAVIYPGEEDFGIGMVEAIAFGKPIIAYAKGGSREIIDENTGIFFEENSPESIKKAVIDFEDKKFDTNTIIELSKKFSGERFSKQFYNSVLKVVNEV